MCVLIHVLQHNYILNCIGHKEWKMNLFHSIAAYIKHYPFTDSVKLIIILMFKTREILRRRKEWFYIITKNNP